MHLLFGHPVCGWSGWGLELGSRQKDGVRQEKEEIRVGLGAAGIIYVTLSSTYVLIAAYQ